MKRISLFLIFVITLHYCFSQAHNYDGEGVIYSESGNVGIGTTSPGERLEIYGGGNLSIKASSNDAGDLIFKSGSSAQLGRIWSNTSGTSGLNLSSGDNNADLSINAAGNIGIGFHDPQHKLHVEGKQKINSGSETDNLLNVNAWISNSIKYKGTMMRFTSATDGNYGHFKFIECLDVNALKFSVNSQGNLYAKGNVGIGITNPNEKLEVMGSMAFSRSSEIKILPFIGGGNSSQTHTIIKNGWRHNQDYTSLHAAGMTNNTEASIVIKGDGNVGIGTTNPSSKLVVDGTIKSEEVKVEVVGADYVFEESYDLASLDEVSEFIKANKHLPEVPSAQEMEQNGLNLGEMNILLLKKIEELTLHLIELNEEIEKLKNQTDE